MINESTRKKCATCSEIAPLLEKQAAEEFLQEEEQKKVDYHLHECEACREFVRLTSSLSIFAQTLSEKALLAAIDNVPNQYFTQKRKQKILAVAVLGISVAAALCVFLYLPEPVEKAEMPLAASAECAAFEQSSPVPGVMMIFCGPGAPDATLSPKGEVLLLMTHGAVGFSVDPNRPNKRGVRVITRFGEVRVIGTIFTVRIDRDDARVEVFRGTVEVRSSLQIDAVFKVKAGQGASIATKKIFALKYPPQSPLARNLLGAESSIQPYDTQIPKETPTEALTDAGVERIDLLEHSADTSAKEPASSADSLIQSAHACLIARDWECAAARYRQILKDYGSRSESVSALIGLARIELHYLHKPKQALSHFSVYERRYPNGPLVEEALLGIAESERQLGRKEEESAALRAFIARYPQSASIEKAKNRLKDLGE